MQPYKKLTRREGPQYLSNIWNLFFKPLTEENFFAEPWENRPLRDCSLFRLTPEGQQELVFCTADPALVEFLSASSGVFLYGAYNQVTVCQMRSKGTIQLVEGSDANEAKEAVRNRLQGESNNDELDFPLTESEVQERIRIVGEGVVFRFLPRQYAYKLYERG